jgi:hypothetical protein
VRKGVAEDECEERNQVEVRRDHARLSDPRAPLHFDYGLALTNGASTSLVLVMDLRYTR